MREEELIMEKVLENIDGGKMIWSIGEWNDTTMELDKDFTAVTTDGEQLEDGIHNIKFVYNNQMTTATVLVTDGKFNESTTDYIGTAVNAAGYWGPYIEGFERTENGIEVLIGS